jgi:predicted exporter
MKTPSRIPLIIWVILLGLASWFVLNMTRVEAELSLLLPAGNTPTQQLLVDQLRHGPTSRLILIGLQGEDLDTRAQASRKLAAWMRESGDFVQVSNGDTQWLTDQQDFLFQYRFLLSPSITASGFTAPALHKALVNRLKDLTSPLSPFVKKNLSRDPTGEFTKILAHWSLSSSPKTFRGVWVSANKQWALLAAETKVAGFDLDAQEDLHNRLQVGWNQLIESSENFHALHMVRTGPAIFAVQSRQQIKAEAQWLAVGATTLVILFIYFLYRSWRVLVLCLIPVASGVVTGIACVNLLFGYIHGVTLAFGVTLIGVAADYPIHFFTHVTPAVPARTALTSIWPIMRLGVVTTAIGYSALLFSGFPGLTQLGIFAIVGLSTAAVVTRWVLPILLSVNFSARPVLGQLVPFIRWLPRVKYLLPVFVLLAGVFLAWSDQPFWEQQLANLSPIAAENRTLDQELRLELGAPDVRDLLIIEASTEEEALRQSETLIPVFNQFVTQGILTGYDIVARYLPSLKTQEERRAALPEGVKLKEALKQALVGLPFRHNIFEPFIQTVETTKVLDPLTKSSFRGTAMGVKIESLLFMRDQQWIALVPLRGVKDREGLIKGIGDQNLEGLYYLDLREESNNLVKGYQKEMVKLLGWGGLFILMSLFLGLQSFARTLRVMIPVICGVLVVAAFLHLIGQRLSLFHLASLLLVVGIGLDYSLFLNRRHDSPEEHNRTVQALIICSITTVLVFGILAFSEFPVLQAIGTTAALGSLLSLLFAAMAVSQDGAEPSYSLDG